jgi:hypothetical protein
MMYRPGAYYDHVWTVWVDTVPNEGACCVTWLDHVPYYSACVSIIRVLNNEQQVLTIYGVRLQVSSFSTVEPNGISSRRPS